MHCFTNTSQHFLRIFIDLVVILDISLIYSALFAIKNNNNFYFYHFFRVCVCVLVKHFANVKVKRSVCGEYEVMRCGEFRFLVEKVTDRVVGNLTSCECVCVIVTFLVNFVL